jgi:hypothetical protein
MCVGSVTTRLTGSNGDVRASGRTHDFQLPMHKEVSDEIINQQLVEELYLLGYNAVWFVVIQPAFRRNMSSPSSVSKNKTGKKPV